MGSIEIIIPQPFFLNFHISIYPLKAINMTAIRILANLSTTTCFFSAPSDRDFLKRENTLVYIWKERKYKLERVRTKDYLFAGTLANGPNP